MGCGCAKREAGWTNSLLRFSKEIRRKPCVVEFVDLTSQIKSKISCSLNLVPNYVLQRCVFHLARRQVSSGVGVFKLLKPTGYVTHHQFNIQQMYALPTLFLCVLCLSENKQRLVPLTA